MKAVMQKAYGSPEVLEVRDIDRPGIGDHDVSVRVLTRLASVEGTGS